MIINNRNLGLSKGGLGEVHANKLLNEQVDFVVHKFDLEMHIIEMKKNLLMGLIVLN
jgi:hypothetical protein